MVTANAADAALHANEDSGAVKFELVGLSTDTKPTVFSGSPIKNGSTFYEMNTGDIFMFDEENQSWAKQ